MAITCPKTCPSASISFSPERLLLRNAAPAPYIATSEMSQSNIIIESLIYQSWIDVKMIYFYLHLLGVLKYWVGHEATQEEAESKVLSEHLQR